MSSNTPNDRRLSDIFDRDADAIRTAWDTAALAPAFPPLPAGRYSARILSGELSTAKTGTPCYKIAFEVLNGKYEGRRLWHDLWLTTKAMPIAKRELAKIGIKSFDQLERPLPLGIRCILRVVIHADDQGRQHNRVKKFTVIGIENDPTADPDFGPGTAPNGLGSGATTTTPPVTGDTGTPNATSGDDAADPTYGTDALLPPADPPSPMEAGR